MNMRYEYLKIILLMVAKLPKISLSNISVSSCSHYFLVLVFMSCFNVEIIFIQKLVKKKNQLIHY